MDQQPQLDPEIRQDTGAVARPVNAIGGGCLSASTGSDRRMVKATKLTQPGHCVAASEADCLSFLARRPVVKC